MSVHYKFKSALDYDTVNFDGLHISVKDLKSNILQAKRIGKSTDFDLQVTNAQTKEVYTDDEALIPKNTSLLIARIPLATQSKSKSWEGYGGDSTPPTRLDDGGPISKAVDLSSMDASEDDKIRAMISQSTQDYDPSNYMRIRGANQVGAVPPNYRCYKCHQSGHWIKDCPLSQGPEPMEIKKSTGIPRSFMVPVEGPQVLGAMMTPNGSYAVPLLDHQTYTQAKPVPAPVVEEKLEIPEDLLCSICTDLLTDAVMIPCCGNSFCDECIRSTLLESDDHECPDCHERNISPGTLIPNRFLRNSVSNFKNTTGYIKKPISRPVVVDSVKVDKVDEASSPKKDAEEQTKSDEDDVKVELADVKKTEGVDFSEDIDISNLAKDKLPEGPPGVSPKREPSPKVKETSKNRAKSSKAQDGDEGKSDEKRKDRSPEKERRRHHPRSPEYHSPLSHEERSGTPTVDEPGMDRGPSSNTYSSNTAPYNSAPPGVLPPMMNIGPPPHMQQGPPGAGMGHYPGTQHPPGVFPQTQGPPPNFRLPPPGTGPAPYMPGPYNAPPRPMYDPTRPPLQGPPPFQNYPAGGRNRPRDYAPRNTLRGRTPPGLIDDPLEAFNRMLREKDERERRARARKGRSYSRSSSRSYSRSPRRLRSRSPRRRSRSRSFSISRSRSRSFSPSPRQSPYREYSPRPLSPRGRRPPSRYRSPARSPPRYRFKDGPSGSDRNRDRDYDRNDRNRDYGGQREDRGYSQRDDYRENRDTRGNERDRDYHYKDNYDSRDYRSRPKGQWSQGSMRSMQQDQYYQSEMHQQPSFLPTNRYPSRDNYQNYMGKPDQHHLPPPGTINVQAPRRYDDVAPPGTEQPPIPGEEPPARYEDRFSYDRSHPEAQSEREQYSTEREARHKDSETRNRPDSERVNSSRDENRERRYDRYNSRSPSNRNARNPSPKRHDSPDKHSKKRRREESTDKRETERVRDKDNEREKERDRDRDREKHHKREYSDDEKLKKSKEKKKKREKKENDKKKRRAEKEERREKKHKSKEEKERRNKEVKVKEESNDEEAVVNEQEVIPEEIHEEVSAKVSDWENDCESKQENGEDHPKTDLYDDILAEGVDKEIMENYGKIDEHKEAKTPEIILSKEQLEDEVPESETSKEYDDVLDLHTNEAELKAELEKSEVLAPVPEKSKWELEDEALNNPAQLEMRSEIKSDKSGKVTNEVLKRAENAIFAKAINAIRPIEIKKISLDRAKLYSGEKDTKRHEDEVRNVQTISPVIEEDIHPPGTEPVKLEPEATKPVVRLSVKERLGVKVDDLDRIVRVDHKRSHSISPFNKRHMEIEERRRFETNRDRHRSYRNRDGRESHRDFRREAYHRREEEVRDRRRDVEKREKHKRSSTPSHDTHRTEKHKKSRDKKLKKEKVKKHKRSEEKEKEEKKPEESKPKAATDRRKATLDEANFEPDYDLETESEKEEEKKVSKKHSSSKTPEIEVVKRPKVEEKKETSSSESSDSSSEEDRRKKKKHKKHKKKSRRESTSSSSDSESESSEDEHKRRKKHKKNKKKRKKSKHK